MAKKILMALVAVLAVAGGIAALSAYEAHIINVTAKIENALSVDTTPIEFGTVFPQEKMDKSLTIYLSDSFLAENRVDDVSYVVNQKPKPRNPADAVYCHENRPTEVGNPKDPYYEKCYPSLCEMLTVTSGEEPQETIGYLSKLAQDTSDVLDINLTVSGFAGMVDQGYTEGEYGPVLPPGLEHQTFGCDLWIEVTDISESLRPS